MHRSPDLQILRELCYPAMPKDKSYSELAEILRKNFSPQSVTFGEQNIFNNSTKITRKNFLSRLEQKAQKCNFGENSKLTLMDMSLMFGCKWNRLDEQSNYLAFQHSENFETHGQQLMEFDSYERSYQQSMKHEFPSARTFDRKRCGPDIVSYLEPKMFKLDRDRFLNQSEVMVQT